MRIAIITPTFRQNPRIREMAQALLANLKRAPEGTELDWFIMDEVLWEPEREKERHEQVEDDLTQAFRAVKLPEGRILGVEHRAPKLSKWRGPGRDPEFAPDGDLPDSNGSRNTALALMRPETDYLCYLDDCALVCNSWLEAVLEAAAAGVALRYKYNAGVRQPKLDQYGCPAGQHVGPLVFCEAAAMKGNAGGYPAELVKRLGGLDECYGGSYGYVEIEFATRAARAGLSFRTTPRATVYEIANDHEPQHASQAVMDGRTNRKKFNQLLRERDRTLPFGPQPTLEEIREELAATEGAAPRRPPERPPRPAEREPTDPSGEDAPAEEKTNGERDRAKTPVEVPHPGGDRPGDGGGGDRDAAVNQIGCASCGRTQALAAEDEPGGVTIEEARKIGWTSDAGEDLWYCPFSPHCVELNDEGFPAGEVKTLRPGTYWNGERYVEWDDPAWSQEEFNAVMRGEELGAGADEREEG